MRESLADMTPVERRSFDRLVNFTDAVVAIAITLQLLPLVDIKLPKGDVSMLSIMADNSSQIIAFILSFVVVAILWIKHNQVFNILKKSDAVIFWLNIAWMIGIVFLPWPSAMYGSLSEDQYVSRLGFGLLYWWTLAAISGIGWLIARYAWSKPELLEPSALHDLHCRRRATNRGASFFFYLLILGLVSEFIPGFLPYLSIGMIPLSLLMKDKKSD